MASNFIAEPISKTQSQAGNGRSRSTTITLTLTSMKKLLVLVVVASVLVACGSPRTAIRVTNKADGTDTKITVSQGDGGSTSVTVNPSVNAALDSINFKIR